MSRENAHLPADLYSERPRSADARHGTDQVILTRRGMVRGLKPTGNWNSRSAARHTAVQPRVGCFTRNASRVSPPIADDVRPRHDGQRGQWCSGVGKGGGNEAPDVRERSNVASLVRGLPYLVKAAQDDVQLARAV